MGPDLRINKQGTMLELESQINRLGQGLIGHLKILSAMRVLVMQIEQIAQVDVFISVSRTYLKLHSVHFDRLQSKQVIKNRPSITSNLIKIAVFSVL